MQRHLLAGYEHLAGVRPEESDHVLQEHRFAGTRSAKDRDDLSRREPEIDPAQDRVAAEALPDPAQLERGLGCSALASTLFAAATTFSRSLSPTQLTHISRISTEI